GHFWTFGEETIYSILATWAQGIHTVDEYSQLVTPQALYVLYAVLGNDVTGALNGFVPFPGPSWENFWKALQLWGVRYYVAARERSAPPQSTGFPVVTLPKRTPPAGTGAPGLWYIFELPRPNVGNYSPTE